MITEGSRIRPADIGQIGICRKSFQGWRREFYHFIVKIFNDSERNFKKLCDVISLMSNQCL
jgi:hypothetical protein